MSPSAGVGMASVGAIVRFLILLSLLDHAW
jgi:hypothetical protein